MLSSAEEPKRKFEVSFEIDSTEGNIELLVPCLINLLRKHTSDMLMFKSTGVTKSKPLIIFVNEVDGKFKSYEQN